MIPNQLPARYLDFRAIGVIAAAAVLLGSPLAAEDFQSVLKNPRAYDHQRVSLVGVVVGDGPVFELFENASDARTIAKPARSFFVAFEGDWKRVRPYDLHRVRITGIVDARRHGIWGSPCQISLKNIEILSAGPVTTSTIPSGVFRNEGSNPVSVRLFDLGGNLQGRFDVSPKRSIEMPISGGVIKVFSLKGSLIALDKLGVQKRSPYYDAKYGTFYYRITDKKIEKVPPSKVNNWEWRR